MFRRTQHYDIIYGLRQSKGSGTQDNISVEVKIKKEVKVPVLDYDPLS